MNAEVAARVDAITQSEHPAVQRRAMAKAITLLESTRADHRALGDELLTALLPYTGKSFRLASVACRAWVNRRLLRRWACT